MRALFRFVVVLIFLCTANFPSFGKEMRILSPNRLIEFKVSSDGSNPVTYAITFKGQPVIDRSGMHFFLDGVDLTDRAEIKNFKTYEVNETYPWLGVHSRATNHCRGAKISLTHGKSKTSYTLEVRAFNDGIAFRYLVSDNGKSRIPDEATTFVIPQRSVVWYHDLEGHYEGVHVKKDISDIKADEWLAPPVTFQLPDNRGYASITEAALINYSGMALQANGERGFVLRLGHTHPASYPFRLRYGLDEAKRLSDPAAISGAITTPWRVVMIGADLNAMVNCDVVHNLCPPPDKKIFPKGPNTDWIKPGRAVWKYLDGGSNTFEEMKSFSTLAGQLGFEHNIIEGFWRNWSDEQIMELTTFAKERHVGIWLWKSSKSLRDPGERRDFLERCRRLRIAGVKVDFFDHEAKEMIDLYQSLLKEAAENKLLLNFHGANKPVGDARTWPNELTREAIKGMESSKLADRATHDTTLPFTRMLAGHAEYTVMHFGERRKNTTWAHQIASAAILSSPLLTYAANPSNILANPACEIIKKIPATWDETIALSPSAIGEVAVFARRKGSDWFLAIMNGVEARHAEIPLSFLSKGEYSATLVRDDATNAASLRIEQATFVRTNSVAIDLSEGGGFIAHFAKTKEIADTKPNKLPRVFLNDPKQLQINRERIRNGDKNLSPALAKLEEDAKELLAIKPFTVMSKKVTPPSGDKHDYMSQAPYFWPNPETTNGLPYVRRDGEHNPEIKKISDHENILEMCGVVETLALAYYFTGDETYAGKATELIRTWFLDPATRMNPNLEYAQFIPGVNTGRGIGLIETRGLVRAVEAIGLLDGSKSWEKIDQQKMEEWFSKFLSWMQESKHGREENAAKNNHGTYYDIQAASLALFIGKKDLATQILRTVREKRIAVQIEPDGRQPLELERTRAWSYSIGNLTGLMTLADLGERVGVDLWHFETEDGRSIRKALEFLVPYATGEKKWDYEQLGNWPPEMLFSSMRRAALKYSDARYQTLLRKIPEADSTSRVALLQRKADALLVPKK